MTRCVHCNTEHPVDGWVLTDRGVLCGDDCLWDRFGIIREKIREAIQLVLIRGLPGTGKSTLAKSDYPDHLHYEPDHLFTDVGGRYVFDAQLYAQSHMFVYQLADMALARGNNVVVSDIFPKVADVEQYRKLAEYHQAEFVVVEAKQKNKNSHDVPLFMMERFAAEFEPYDSGCEVDA